MDYAESHANACHFAVKLPAKFPIAQNCFSKVLECAADSPGLICFWVHFAVVLLFFSVSRGESKSLPNAQVAKLWFALHFG